MVHLCLYFCCDHLPLNRHFHFSPFLQLLLPRFLDWSGTQPLKCELLFFCVCVRCPITLATRIASVISPMHSNTADWSVFVLCGISITGCALVASAPLYIFFLNCSCSLLPNTLLEFICQKKMLHTRLKHGQGAMPDDAHISGALCGQQVTPVKLNKQSNNSNNNKCQFVCVLLLLLCEAVLPNAQFRSGSLLTKWLSG